MQALAEEWRKRDGEREALVKKKVESPHPPTHRTHMLLRLFSTPICVFVSAGGGVQPAGGAASEDSVGSGEARETAG